MEAKERSLQDALNLNYTYHYNIPKFQRPYIWDEKKHIKIFYDELFEAYKRFKAQDENDPFEKYFLGPIVIVENKKEKRYEIVDGQQRITTLHILFCYLLKKLNDENEKETLKVILFHYGNTRLRVCNSDSAKFLLITNPEERNIVGDTEIDKCARFFKREFENFSHEDALSFSKFLREYIQFVVIISDNYSDAWDLFIGLNYKGEPLNPSDLIKAFVCGNSENERIGDIWENSIKILGEDSTPFFLTITRYKLAKYISENNLYRSFSRNFLNSIKETDLVEFSNIYYLFWLIAIDDINVAIGNNFNISTEAKRALRMIRDLGRKDCTILLFKYADKYGIENIFNIEFLKPLASFQMRMAVAGERTKERNFIKLDTGDDYEKSLILIKDFYNNLTSDNEEFKTQIKKLKYPDGSAKIILKECEEGDIADWSITDFQIEHVMPQKGTNYWFEIANTIIENDYLKIVNKIGNLFVIGEKINKSIKNDIFPNKKIAYQEKLTDWSIARITRDIEIWNEEEIDKRTEEIADWAVKKFTV